MTKLHLSGRTRKDVGRIFGEPDKVDCHFFFLFVIFLYLHEMSAAYPPWTRCHMQAGSVSHHLLWRHLQHQQPEHLDKGEWFTVFFLLSSHLCIHLGTSQVFIDFGALTQFVSFFNFHPKCIFCNYFTGKWIHKVDTKGTKTLELTSGILIPSKLQLPELWSSISFSSVSKWTFLPQEPCREQILFREPALLSVWFDLIITLIVTYCLKLLINSLKTIKLTSFLLPWQTVLRGACEASRNSNQQWWHQKKILCWSEFNSEFRSRGQRSVLRARCHALNELSAHRYRINLKLSQSLVACSQLLFPCMSST